MVSALWRYAMTFFIILIIVFLIIGIAEQVYFYRKILGAVNYFLGHLSKLQKILITTGAFLLTFVPAFYAFAEWFIIEFHIAVFLLLTDLAAVIVRKKNITLPEWAEAVYKTGAVAFLLTCVVIGYGKYNMYHIVRTDYDVTVDKSLSHEYTIALVADLHYGISLDAEELQAVANEIEAASPDFVVLCGDIVDENTTLEGMDEAFSILGGIKSRLGVYYVYGNHDSSNYRNLDPSTGDSVDKHLRKAITDNRIAILEDHAVLINEDIVFVGRRDSMKGMGLNEGRMSIRQILKNADRSKVIVVAEHQPNDYETLRKAGCDLVLSGHTHGGQIFPFGFFAELFKANDMTYGCEKWGNLNAIVTSGIAGWGFDLRTEHHSEYVMIHLKGKNDQ